MLCGGDRPFFIEEGLKYRLEGIVTQRINLDRDNSINDGKFREKNYTSLILILGIAGFISAADNWIVSPVLPAIATGFGVSVAVAGIIFTSYMIPYGFMQPVYGFISDKHGKIRVLQMIVLGLALGTFACALSSSLWVLCICRAFTGFFAAGIVALSLAWIGDNVPESQRQTCVGKFMGIVFLGQGMSVGIGGFIANYASWRVAFILFGLAAVTSELFLQKIPENFTPTKHQRNFFKEVKDVCLTSKGKIIFPLAFLTGFLLIGLYSYLGAFLHEISGLNYLEIGLVLMFYGFACLIAGTYVGKMGNKFGQQKTVLTGACFALFTPFLLFFFPFWQVILLATVSLGFAYILMQFPLATIAFDVSPETKGLPSALIGLGLFGGGGLGSAFYGYLLQLLGYGAIWFAAALGSLILIFIVTRVDLDFGHQFKHPRSLKE